MSVRTPIAVFDLDGTLVNGQSGALMSRYLLSRKVITLPQAARLAWWGIRYKAHLPMRQDEPREIILGEMNRNNDDDIVTTMEDFHDEVMIRRYRPKGIQEVTKRKAEGCATLLASATFQDVARRAAEFLEMDGFVATEMERDAMGDYTGLVQGEVIEGREKLEAVERWADDHYGPGNWYLAYAYGDHFSDATLLAAARRPFAVQPGPIMRSIARRHKWTILKWGTRA